MAEFYSFTPCSEQQYQILSTLKDLADEKLLQMKDEILNTLKKRANAAVGQLSAQLSAQLSLLVEDSRAQKIRCILDSLDFETRQSRQSDISDVEDRTFEWIFHNHHGPSNQRIGFGKWLQVGNDIYWISGIAGSGKSVLMNYIANEPRTQRLLRSWAGDAKVIIAKYFFWNAGAPMQKSQQGLFQSLLRDIFGQCPELVPIVCASRWKRYHEIGGTWTRLELSDAFRKLSQQRLLNLKFCFFIDGVDEYDGEDYNHIIDILKNLNASPSVKICLSSRPWNIFIAAFGTDPDTRLLLEDHNGEDIQKYVTKRFESDEQFALLQSRDPRSSDLVDQIVRNAQGVFLWVRIVVSNLLRGLRNNDSLSDLHRRLQSFPTTLTAYFQHMFDSIDDFYREETSEILLICLEGIQPLSLLALWFYEQERLSPDYAMQVKRSALSRTNVVAIFESIHKRINARGQDLLVIEVDTTNLEHLMYTVRFLHRTVKDFLSKPEMLERLNSWRRKAFEAKATLCKATVAIVKSLPMSTDIDSVANANRCWSHISDFFAYAQSIEDDNGTLDDSLVDELQRVVSSFRKHDKRGSIWSRFLWVLDHWACWVNKNDMRPVKDTLVDYLPHHDRDMASFFFALAAEANLKRYVEHKLEKDLRLINRLFLQRPILDRSLRPPSSTWRTSSIDPDMIHLLLMKGANPNEALNVYNGQRAWNAALIQYTSESAWTTTWALFLQRLHEAKISKKKKSPDLVQAELKATNFMIDNGAAADLRPWRILALQKPCGDPTLTPSDIFREVFPHRDAVHLDQLLRKNRPWAFRRAYSWVNRTVLLWFYRDIYVVVWSLNTLYPMFFNQTFGVILPMVIIPTVGYFLWLVWSYASAFVLPVIPRTAPILLLALVLSDWIPILDGLIWLNKNFVQRMFLLSWKDDKSDRSWR